MKIKQLWCVGFRKESQLKLSFRVYDAVLNGDTYTIDFSIHALKGEYKVSCHPDILTLSSVNGLDFKMIAQTDGIHILRRFENDIDFINAISPVIKEYLLNNEIHINFELNKESYETLIAS